MSPPVLSLVTSQFLSMTYLHKLETTRSEQLKHRIKVMKDRQPRVCHESMLLCAEALEPRIIGMPCPVTGPPILLTIIILLIVRAGGGGRSGLVTDTIWHWPGTGGTRAGDGFSILWNMKLFGLGRGRVLGFTWLLWSDQRCENSRASLTARWDDKTILTEIWARFFSDKKVNYIGQLCHVKEPKTIGQSTIVCDSVFAHLSQDWTIKNWNEEKDNLET